MVRDEVHVDAADEVGGAHEIAQPVANEIAEVEETECAEAHAHADRPRVFSANGAADLDAFACRVRLSAAVERPGERRAVGAHDVHLHAAERQSIAGLGHEVLAAPAGDFVGRKRRHDFRRGFDRRAVVDERPNRNPLRELRHAAVVVLVKMRDQEIVDAGEARVLDRGHDPIGIAAVLLRIAGVDEQRLPRRRDDERRLAAFDVDEIDVAASCVLAPRSDRRASANAIATPASSAFICRTSSRASGRW